MVVIGSKGEVSNHKAVENQMKSNFNPAMELAFRVRCYDLSILPMIMIMIMYVIKLEVSLKKNINLNDSP